MAYTEKPWDGSASRFSDAAAYCSACLVDNNGSGSKVAAECHFPYKEPNGDINVNALRAIVGGRGAQASFPGAEAARSKARSMFERYQSSQGRSEEDELDADELDLGLSDGISFCRGEFDDAWETRDTGGSLPMLVGKFASYGNWNEIRSRSEARDMGLRGDRYMERVLPGSFTKTLQERAGQIKVLFNHGTDPSIGKKPLGKIVNVTERSDGPQYEVQLYDVGYVRDLLPALKDGQFGSSYRSDLVKGRLRRRAEKADHNPDGLPEATVSEIRLKELGPVTFPAEKRATAGIRSLTDWVRSEDIGLALRNLIHEEAIAELEPECLDCGTARAEEEEETGLVMDEIVEEGDAERSEAATLEEVEPEEFEPVQATAVYLGTSRRTRRQRSSTDYLSTEEVRPKWHL